MFPVVSLRKGHGDDKELGPMLEDAWTAVERLRKFLQHFERKRCFFPALCPQVSATSSDRVRLDPNVDPQQYCPHH